MNLDEKLEQARSRAEHYGQLRGRKETADDYVKLVYAQLYDNSPEGPVAERDAWVKRQNEYRLAIEEKANRYAEWTAAETYMKILFAELDKYRTDRATERTMDKHHQ